MNSENKRLDNVAENSLYLTMSNKMMIEYCHEVFRRHLIEGNVLEMGPAEGLMTNFLYQNFDEITLLDGSKVFCDALASKFPNALVVNLLFEEFNPTTKYDNIVLGHVLEHVSDPALLLKQIRNWLSPKGLILAAVPNSQSLHRQAAVLMNLIQTEKEMSELDYHHGHRRIYDPFSFRSEFLTAGLEIQHYGGYWLKPVSNAQIHASWTDEMLLSFMKLGERYPDIAGEIYIVASNPKPRTTS
jgi:2-polyprenyl-3-methyl-5-hydroxy-6-metoxy-1,4-benzoquinol methylase